MRLALLLTLPTLVLSAQDAPQPAISFDAMHHNFGKISPDKKVGHKFKVFNKGNAVLNITGVNPSCGCTYTAPAKWSLTPGESTEIEAIFNPTGYRGPVRKSLVVISNDPKKPSETLTFEAEVIQEINLKSNAIFFLDVPRTKPMNSSIRLESGNGEQVVITEVKAAGAPYYRFSHRSDGKDAVLDITFDGKLVPTGQQRGADTITIRHTNPRVPPIVLTSQWELKPAITATPDKVVWQEQAGKELRTKLVLKSATGKPFILKFVSCTNANVRLEGLSPHSAPQQEFTVILGKGAKPGTTNDWLTLSTSDPDQPQLLVRIAAILS